MSEQRSMSPDYILQDGDVVALSPANVKNEAYRGKFGPADDGCLLVSAESAGRLHDLSERSWWRMNAAGEVPAPVLVGTRSRRWDVAELRAWNQAGRPSRAKWEEIKRRAGA